MNTEQSEALESQPRDWPRSRLIAFSTMLFTTASISIFAAIAIALSIAQPDLGKESLVLPALGILLISGTLLASLGLLAGVLDLIRSRDRRGITVASVAVHSIAILIVWVMILNGLSTLQGG